jgi:hypothetical protein
MGKRRLDYLRTEHAEGERRLARLLNDEKELRGTMLRIAGAIQVPEELLGPDGGTPGPG